MNVEIFEHSNPTKLQKMVNDWLDDKCYDENAHQIREVIDIKLVSCDSGYAAMIIYNYI